MPVVLIRHGPTPWNRQHRLQGRRDIALEAEARAWLAGRRLPARFTEFEWHSSPLGRAVETARLLGARRPRFAPGLTEMDWGDWEGQTLTALRRRDGARMARNEARGLDLRPSGGESPREVRARLQAWLDQVAAGSKPVVAVTHKGVIRAALSLATGWNLCTAPPQRLDWSCAHEFAYEPDSRALEVVRLNLALACR